MPKQNPTTKRHCMIVHAHYPLGEPRVEREAQALINGGYEVDVLCLRSENEAAFEVVDGVNIHRLPVKRDKKRGRAAQLLEYLAFFVMVVLRLLSLHPRRKYKTLQVHNLPDFLVFSTLIPKLAGARVILDLHDLMPEFFAGTYNKSMDSLPVRILKFQEWLSCQYADHVITVTDLWRDTLIERSAPAHKVSVVMNVANGNIFKNGVVKQTSNGDSRFKLIYHGTLSQHYGIDLVLRAVSQLKDAIPQLHVTIHGRGEYLQNLLDLAKELKLNGQVTFSTNLMPITDLPAFIGQADLGIIPYRRDVFTDGILPTKLMEYTALHVPVIAARTPAIEAYFDENMVQYFPAEDVNALCNEITYLHNHRDQLQRISTASDQFNKKYNWEGIAREYLETVNRLSN
jgi:glycosyltransferase involved in cell wall biosynthesis